MKNILNESIHNHSVPFAVAGWGNKTGLCDIAAANLPGQFPVQLDSIFRIASMTKPIVSIAMLQLVEKKLVDLDQDVTLYAPDLGKKQILTSVDDQGNAEYTNAKNPITIRKLLTHTSGLSYDFMNEKIFKLVMNGKLPATGTAKEFLNAPLVAEPGTAFNYSISTDWVGELIARISKKTLGDYLYENIFSPLGMHDTSFQLDSNAKQRLTPCLISTNGEFQTSDQVPQGNKPSYESGGGGLYSTVSDYAKFCQLLLNYGKSATNDQILSADTVNSLQLNQIGNLEFPLFTTVLPDLVGNIEILPGINKKWGFAGLLTPDGIPNIRTANSFSWAGIFNTYFSIDWEVQKFSIAMMQMQPFYTKHCVNTMTDVESYIYKI